MPVDAIDEKSPAAAVAWSGVGRVTAGHLAVLCRVDVSLVAVDEPLWPATPDGRDAAMADNVERLLRTNPGRVLFVAGSMHTRLELHEHYAPVGMHLARTRPDLCSLEIDYARGQYWNLGARNFEASDGPPGHHLTLSEATEAVVPTR